MIFYLAHRFFVAILLLCGVASYALGMEKSQAPTLSYLSVPKLKKEVESRWKNELTTYAPVIDSCIAREKILCPTHYIFYHAQNCSFRILHDFTKELYHFLYPDVVLDEFEFLRIFYDMAQTYEVNTFIEKEESGYPLVWDDNQKHLSRQMLSVNLSLFGNTINLGNKGECSFRYYFMGWSIKAPPVEELISSIFDRFNFNKKYLAQLMNLSEQVVTSEGLLFQIALPKKMADQYVFLAQRLGSPFREPIVHDIFNYTKQRHMKISPILELYQKSPQSIDSLDRLQARILLSRDCMLNPQSGVKIIRYDALDSLRLQKYQVQFKKITSDLFAEWIARLKKGKAFYDASIIDSKTIKRLKAAA